MRKNCIKTGILSLSLILLSACATPDNGGMTGREPDLGLPERQSINASAETMPEETVSDISRATVSESGGESNRVEQTQDQEKGSQEISLTVYLKTVEESNTGTVFSLINLDGDEIPELVAGDRGNDRYFIYTIKDGIVFCLVDSMTTVELTYFEGTGIIAAFARWNGGGDEGGYGWQYYQTSAEKTLTDEDIPILSYSYNAVYDEEGVYTGKGVTDYFSMGQETDESAYNEILGMLGITEDDGTLCLENAVTAEEMLDILR